MKGYCARHLRAVGAATVEEGNESHNGRGPGLLGLVAHMLQSPGPRPLRDPLCSIVAMLQRPGPRPLGDP